MNAPQSIHDVLREPHVKRTIRRGIVIVQEVEPLRVIPLSSIGKCRECGCDRYDRTCGISRCPQRGAWS